MDLTYDKVDQTVLPISNTRVVASEYNQIAGSLMSIISASGLTPDSADNTQLLNALKAIGSGWAMPNSDTYSNLTPGASGASYTAPSNGWMYAVNTPTANGQFLAVYNSVSVEIAVMWSVGSNPLYVSWPVVKGNSYRINYSSGTLSKVLFFYAEGSKSEAN